MFEHLGLLTAALPSRIMSVLSLGDLLMELLLAGQQTVRNTYIKYSKHKCSHSWCSEEKVQKEAMWCKVKGRSHLEESGTEEESSFTGVKTPSPKYPKNAPKTLQ